MVVFTPAIAAAALMIMPELSSLVGKLTGKETEADILGTLLALPGMAAGVLGKSSSTGLKIGSELSKSTVEKLSHTDGSVMSRIVGMNKGGHLTQPGQFNSMQINSSGIFDAFDKGRLSHNPLDLFS